MKNSTRELYGDIPESIILLQKNIAKEKIKYAKKRLKELHKAPFWEREELLINKVVKAISWNEALVNEEY